MKLLIVLPALLAVCAGLQRESEYMTQLPESWYEEEAAKALAGDSEAQELPHFLNVDEELSGDFGASKFNGDPKNVLDVAAEQGASIFVRAAYLTKTADTFKNTQGITVFVPSNAAFARLPRDLYFYFLRHPDRLGDLLKYHAAQGVLMVKDLVNDKAYTTLFSNWTLRYDAYSHVASNDTTRVIQASQISHRRVDNVASNGVVHIIDEVVLALPLVNAYEIVSRSEYFSTLYDGLIVAGMDQVLKSAGPFTLFAPTQDAFKRLPAGAWEALLKDKAALTDVLDMHVSSQTYFARGFRDMDTIGTLNKAAGLTIHVRGPRSDESVDHGHRGVEVEVNDARIVYFDGAVTNGVIQVIDRVLLPPKIKEQFNLV